MDFMLYTMAVGQLRTYFEFGDDVAGMLGTVTLVMSGVGGTIFGYVADRFGRTRALMGDDPASSPLASLGAATSQIGDAAAVLARRARHRHGRRVGLGRRAGQRDLAGRTSATRPSASCSPAGRSATCWRRSRRRSSWARRRSAPTPGAGCSCWASLPAFFTLWIRRYVQEPESWTRPGRGDASGRTRSRSSSGPACSGARCSSSRSARRCSSPTGACSSGCPTFLARPVDQGGAGMGIVGSLPWIIPVQLGAYFGYLTFGFIADRIGRRRAFVLYMVAAARARADLRPDGAQPARPAGARSAARLLRLRLLQHVRRLRGRAVSRRRCAPPGRARPTTSDGWRAPWRRSPSA